MPLFMEPILEGISGVPDCFPGVLITGRCYLLDSGVMDPRDDACKFKSSSGCQDNCVRACLLADMVLLANLQPIPHLLDDWDEPNCPKEWVSFQRFLGRYGGRLFPGNGGVRTSPDQLFLGGFP